jgi:hypothetical protein
MNSDPAPSELIEALLRGDAAARACLERWCRTPIDRMVRRVVEFQPSLDGEALVGRTLRWVEMYLRSRGSSAFLGASRSAFVAELCSAAYRVLSPSGPDAIASPQSGRPRPDKECLPESCPYALRSLSQPVEKVGGDWWSADAAMERALWVIVADVTGHGYMAHVVAAGLPHLWRTRRIIAMRGERFTPRELLNALGQELADCLPDGVFVEAALGRLSVAGAISVAGAGNCCIIIRRSGRTHIDLHDFGGFYLGMELGDRDQREWSLGVGDELMLASDGLHEQPCGENLRLKAGLACRVEGRLASGHDLHDAVLDALEKVLRAHPQADDITVVTVGLRREYADRSGSRVAV